MKIAIVTDVIYPFTIGGSEIRNHEIAKRLVKKGHQVYILGAKLWDGENKLEIDGVKIIGLHKYERLYKKDGKRARFVPLILSVKIFLELLKHDFDIIDTTAFTFFNCYTTKLASVIKRVPLVLTWQQYFGNYLTGYFGFIMGNIAQILERVSVLLTKNHLAVSEFVKSELANRGVKEKNIKVIYNGADIKLINKIPKQNKIYDLIFVGRLNYQKNLQLLVESINILKIDFKNIRVAIVGKGEEKENLDNLIKKLGLLDNFFFLGATTKKEEIFGYLKSSKIFVLPSILEGFPLTIIEANACGLPVITTKTEHNNTTEYVKENENGVLANPNIEDFSNAISFLLKNPSLLKKMQDIGIKKAKDFDWDIVADKQEKYYKKII